MAKHLNELSTAELGKLFPIEIKPVISEFFKTKEAYLIMG
jgi:hypothetical protein